MEDSICIVGKDTICIINQTMSKNLSLILRSSFKLDSISYKNFILTPFQNIYDSLSKLFMPIKYYFISHDIIPYNDGVEGNEILGINVFFEFLIDSNTKFNICVYIPDNIFKFEELNQSNF